MTTPPPDADAPPPMETPPPAPPPEDMAPEGTERAPAAVAQEPMGTAQTPAGARMGKGMDMAAGMMAGLTVGEQLMLLGGLIVFVWVDLIGSVVLDKYNIGNLTWLLPLSAVALIYLRRWRH